MKTPFMISEVVGCGKTISSISSSRSSVSSMAVAPKIISEHAPRSCVRQADDWSRLQNDFAQTRLIRIFSHVASVDRHRDTSGIDLQATGFRLVFGQADHRDFRARVNDCRHLVIAHPVRSTGQVVNHDLGHSAGGMGKPSLSGHVTCGPKAGNVVAPRSSTRTPPRGSISRPNSSRPKPFVFESAR